MHNSQIVKAASLINGKEVFGSKAASLEIFNPFNGSAVGKVFLADEAVLEKAIVEAQQTYKHKMKKMTAYQRADILYRTAFLLEEQGDRFVRMLAMEAGKPLRDGRAEVSRAVQLLKFAAEEAKSIEGEMVPMDSAVGGEHRVGMVFHEPLGVVAAITPFNFPLNLVLHKIAPAIAAGNSVVLKPSMKTPLSAIMLAKLFIEAGLPPGTLNVILGAGAVLGDSLVSDHRVQKVSFTGSVSVGLHINKLAGLKKVTLELGSNSPNIVFADADMDSAVRALVHGSFAYAGQVCISVQRIYVQQEIYDDFLHRFVEQVKKIIVGDPMDEHTELGPMISEQEAIRVEQWVQEAVNQGAQILAGGYREGTLFRATILTNVSKEMNVVCQEAFAPVVSIIPFQKEEEAVDMANDSDFGLQAGLFTNHIHRALRVARDLETGGVWINEVSAYRQDNYPYGGVKLSGMGKEGVKYAIKEMMDLKFVGIKYESYE